MLYSTPLHHRGEKLSKPSNWFAMVCLVWTSQTNCKSNVPKTKPIFQAFKPKCLLSNLKPFLSISNQLEHANNLSSHPNWHSIPCILFANKCQTRSGIRNPCQHCCCVCTVRHPWSASTSFRFRAGLFEFKQSPEQGNRLQLHSQQLQQWLLQPESCPLGKRTVQLPVRRSLLHGCCAFAHYFS